MQLLEDDLSAGAPHGGSAGGSRPDGSVAAQREGVLMPHSLPPVRRLVAPGAVTARLRSRCRTDRPSASSPASKSARRTVVAVRARARSC